MVAFRFEDRIERQKKVRTPIGDLRFRQLFNETDWEKLPLAVRQRFGHRLTIGDAIVYRGQVEYNHINRWGRFLNFAMRLIGAPLPVDTNNACLLYTSPSPRDS